MRTTFSVRLLAAASASLVLAIAVSAGTAGAQKPDARWTPWLGCWSSGAASVAGGMVCVEPAPSGMGVNVATIANGRVVHNERINATGVRTPRTMESCPGWEMATWSADGRRLLMRSEFTCGQNTTVKGSGVFSFGQDGEWIQVQGSTVGRNASAYVVRYRPAGVQLADMAGVQPTDSMPVRTVPAVTGFAEKYARSAAGDPVPLAAVLEVARNVETPVASAWLNELDQRFSVSGKELVRLADAGMPPSVIDQMVAMAYPAQFAVERIDASGRMAGQASSSYGTRSMVGTSGMYGSRWNCGYGDAMLAYGYYGDSCYPGARYGMYGYSPYGYSMYGINSYGYGYGYGGFGGNGYYYGQQPIIIIPRSDASRGVPGQAVNGAGYRRTGGTPSSGTSSTYRGPRGASTSSGSSGSSSTKSSGSSSAGSSTSGSSGSSSEPRTAKPRVPPG